MLCRKKTEILRGAIAVLRSHSDVLECVLVVRLFCGFIHCLYDLCRRAEYEAVWWDDASLRDEGIRADDRAMTYDSSVEDGSAHADEALVLYLASMQGDAVTDRDVLTYFAAVVVSDVEAGVVLNVGSLTHRDEINVTAQGGVVPDGGVFCDGYFADEVGTSCDECAGIHAWAMFVKCFDYHALSIQENAAGVNGTYTATKGYNILYDRGEFLIFNTCEYFHVDLYL